MSDRTVKRDPASLRTASLDLGVFMGVMWRESRVALVSCGSLALVTIVLGSVGKSVPAWFFGICAGLVFVAACFTAWRKAYYGRLLSEEKIAELESRVAILENPPISVKVERVELTGATDIFSPNREWKWELSITLRVTPSIQRMLTFDNQSGANITVANDPRHLLMFQFKYFVDERGSKQSVQSVKQPSTIACVAVTGAQGWVDPLPSELSARIRLIDLNSEWRDEITAALTRQRSDDDGPKRRWIGW
jgi:hypothetical protein